jgi:hypothetical protein
MTIKFDSSGNHVSWSRFLPLEKLPPIGSLSEQALAETTRKLMRSELARYLGTWISIFCANLLTEVTVDDMCSYLTMLDSTRFPAYSAETQVNMTIMCVHRTQNELR